MPELRYRLVIDGTQVASDFTDPDPTRDSGQITLTGLTALGRIQMEIAPAAAFSLSDQGRRAGVNEVRFVAITAPAPIFISKTDVATERWALQANGWFMCHQVDGLIEPIILRNPDVDDAVVVTVYLGGLTI